MTLVLGLASAGNTTLHFSEDAGGVFARLPEQKGGLMMVVQNKLTGLNPPSGGGGGPNLTWTAFPGKTHGCTSSEYKGAVPDVIPKTKSQPHRGRLPSGGAAERGARARHQLRHLPAPRTPGSCYVPERLRCPRRR